MLSSEFDEVLDVLRRVLRNVQRFTNKRTQKWYLPHIVEEKKQRLRLNEIKEFNLAAKELLLIINDKDVQREPLPWQTLRRHVENIPLWLERLKDRPEDYVYE